MNPQFNRRKENENYICNDPMNWDNICKCYITESCSIICKYANYKFIETHFYNEFTHICRREEIKNEM